MGCFCDQLLELSTTELHLGFFVDKGLIELKAPRFRYSHVAAAQCRFNRLGEITFSIVHSLLHEPLLGIDQYSLYKTLLGYLIRLFIYLS